MTTRAAVVLALVALLLSPGALAAQTVRGRLTRPFDLLAGQTVDRLEGLTVTRQYPLPSR